MTVKACLIGYPVAHSLSPCIHKYWLKHYGIDGSFETIEINPAENLSARLQQLKEAGYAGVNSTLPFKEQIFELCDEVDDTARTIGAVNIALFKDDRIYGRNTDSWGFIESIKTQHPGFDLSSTPVRIIGGGGAARAIIHGLLQQDVPEIIIVNRTAERAEGLMRCFKQQNPAAKIKTLPWQDRSKNLDEVTLLINAGALGMTGKPALDMDLKGLNPGALVVDIIYDPVETNLLRAAQKRGHRCSNGMGMLLHQARLIFRHLYGVMPEITEELQTEVFA